MPLRTRTQILLTLTAAVASLVWAWRMGSNSWLGFWLLLLAVLVSSGLKIALPSSDSSMSLNFPFILLGLLELSPFQAMLLAAISVAVVCRIRVRHFFSAVQILFNVATSVLATACAYAAFVGLRQLEVASAPALALASVVYFLVNTGSVAAVIASSKGESAFRLWRGEFPWYLPFYVVGAILAATAKWLSKSFGWANALLLIPVAYTLYRAYTSQVSRLKERQEHIEESEALQLRTIEGLAMAIEAKDQNTHDHLFRVRTYVQAVGSALHLDKLELQALHTAAFLHDIGKLAVPEAIINKPGKLTPEEFEKMKIHPVVGADILERVRFPYPVVPIVRSHHEWWNGTGYPDGLKGEEIPLGARILTVVDCFDALVSDRPYRKGMTATQALAILRSMSGKQFDPKVVTIFEQYHAEMEQETQAIVETGFTPLNTEVEVWRGKAPGAGFEAGSDPVKNASLPDHTQENTLEYQDSGANCLALVAAAAHQVQAIFEMTQQVGNVFTQEEVFAIIALRVKRLVPHDLCAVYRKQKDTLSPWLTAGPNAASFQAVSMAIGEGISGWVAQSGKPLLNGNAAIEPGCALSPPGEPLLRTTLSVPLFDLEQQIQGVLTLFSAAPDAFTRDHLRVLQTMQPKLSLALENGLQHLERTAQVAVEEESDPLTGLPSARALFLQLENRLKESSASGTPLSIVVCDLNGFKDVNDRRGQIAGNRVLVQLADALRQNRAKEEWVARMGGDEFVVLLPGADAAAATDSVAAITAVINTTLRRSSQGMHVTASIATATFPADGAVAEDLLACANRRMYLEKQRFYSASTTQSLAALDPASLVACTK